jgi:glycosyltransferase involved in cell wall biosynthesis
MLKKDQVLGYILKGYPRISETFISNEILLLEQLGFKISLFPMRHPRENFCHDSVKKIKAEIHYLPTHLFRNFFQLITPNLLLAIKHPGKYGHALSIALKRFARTKKTATFKHLFQAGYMVNNHLLKSPEITHLHGHFAHSPTSVTMFASLLSGIPFSFTAHAKDIYTSNREQLREKISMARFVATCTRYNARYLEEIADSVKTPIHCIYHGIDTDLFHAEGARVNCAPPYNLLTVARITEKKGLPTIYNALATLKKRGISFTHTLIGDGDDREAVLSLITQLGLEQDCLWLGTQTHEKVLQQFQKSDLFILGCEVAKNGDRDGIPNVLVESLAMGVPAISTNVSAIPELILNKKTGLVVPPSDSDEMADGILHLLNDNALRQKVIQEGQSYVREDFDNKELTAKLGSIFQQEMDKHGR